MKIYRLRVSEYNKYYEEYYYTVEAENEEEAKEKVKTGNYIDWELDYQEWDGCDGIRDILDITEEVDDEQDTDNT